VCNAKKDDDNDAESDADVGEDADVNDTSDPESDIGVDDARYCNVQR
jgi:hypothetical protein